MACIWRLDLTGNIFMKSMGALMRCAAMSVLKVHRSVCLQQCRVSMSIRKVEGVSGLTRRIDSARTGLISMISSLPRACFKCSACAIVFVTYGKLMSQQDHTVAVLTRQLTTSLTRGILASSAIDSPESKPVHLLSNQHSALKCVLSREIESGP